MTLIRPSFVILALALQFMTARADHTITFVNKCPFDVTPMWKDNADGSTNHQASKLGPGKTTSATIPEVWESGRFYAQDPHNDCLLPDGARCTLVECNYGPEHNFNQCNLSLVSGFNLPTEFSFTDHSCSGRSCLSGSCPETDAWLVGNPGCNNCLTQCNTVGVGMTITYCPSGSTIPNFGQSAAPAPAPSKPKPAPAPPKAVQPPPKASPKPSPPAEQAENPESHATSSHAPKASSGAHHCPASHGRRRHRLGRSVFSDFERSH